MICRYLGRAALTLLAAGTLLSVFTIPLLPVALVAIGLSFPRFRQRFFTAVMAPFGSAPDGRTEWKLVGAFLGSVAIAVAAWTAVVLTVPQGDRTNGHWLAIAAVGVTALFALAGSALRQPRG